MHLNISEMGIWEIVSFLLPSRSTSNWRRKAISLMGIDSKRNNSTTSSFQENTSITFSSTPISVNLYHLVPHAILVSVPVIYNSSLVATYFTKVSSFYKLESFVRWAQSKPRSFNLRVGWSSPFTTDQLLTYQPPVGHHPFPENNAYHYFTSEGSKRWKETQDGNVSPVFSSRYILKTTD